MKGNKEKIHFSDAGLTVLRTLSVAFQLENSFNVAMVLLEIKLVLLSMHALLESGSLLGSVFDPRKIVPNDNHIVKVMSVVAPDRVP